MKTIAIAALLALIGSGAALAQEQGTSGARAAAANPGTRMALAKKGGTILVASNSPGNYRLT